MRTGCIIFLFRFTVVFNQPSSSRVKFHTAWLTRTPSLLNKSLNFNFCTHHSIILNLFVDSMLILNVEKICVTSIFSKGHLWSAMLQRFERASRNSRAYKKFKMAATKHKTSAIKVVWCFIHNLNGCDGSVRVYFCFRFQLLLFWGAGTPI